MRLKRGFTLIEILIVMGLLGVLFGILFGTHLQVRKLLADQSIASNNSNEVLAFMKTLSADLHNLVYKKWQTKQLFIATKDIVGGKRIDNLLFTTGRLYNNPASLQTQVHNVSYFGDTTKNGSIQIFRREDVFADPNNPGQGFAVPMAGNIEEFSVQFSQGGTNWEDEWDFAIKQVMPRYIRCTLRWKERDQERSFSFEVRPPLLWY